MNRFQRNEMLFTPEGVRKLKDKKVTVFGVGGVGGYVCEMLGRSGIGHFVLVDKDQVDVTNINRQIIALSSTVGKDKVEVMKERLIEINPECEVTSVKAFLLPENKGDFDFEHNDFVVDAIDTVSAKIVIAEECTRLGVPLISSMGTGNKLHPEMLKITDKFPSELSCAEAAQADPQSIVANVTAATAVLTMVYNILTHGENIALQTDFSTRTIRMQTVLEKQPRRKAA